MMEFVKDIHKSEYGETPQVLVSAPGRIHLIGEHSWFFKDKTLSMGVNLPVYVAVSARSDNAVHFYFPQLKDRKKANISSLKVKKEDKWANPIKAMIYGFTAAGYEIKGMNFTIYSDILPSAGFGITTAIKIGTAFAIRELNSLKCSDAQLLQAVERGNKLFLSSYNYISDIYAAVHSRKNTLVLTDHATQSFENIPFNFENKSIVLVDAKVPRVNIWNEEMIREPESALLLGELKERKANVHGGWHYEENPHEVNIVLSVAPEDIHKKLYSVILEHQYLIEAYDGLSKNSFGAFARAVNKSHENMRDIYEISCPEIDWLIKRLLEIEPNNDDPRNPFSCGRITGKGFGRCMYDSRPEPNVPEFEKKLAEYTKIFGFHASSYVVETEDGVHLV